MKLFLHLRLIDQDGRTHAAMCQEVHEDTAYMGERIGGSFRSGLFPGNFDDAVRILKIKEFRRQLLVFAATQLGGSLADHLEDKEGWHGIDRQDAILDGKERKDE